GPPIKCRCLIDDLIEADRGKIRELHFNNRAHPVNGRADGQSDYRILADRRINDPAGKLLRQIFRRFERAAECANVLPVDEHARVFGQCPRLRLANGFQVRNAHTLFIPAVPRALRAGAATTTRASLPRTDRAMARAERSRRHPRLFEPSRSAKARWSARQPSLAATNVPRPLSGSHGRWAIASIWDLRSQRHRARHVRKAAGEGPRPFAGHDLPGRA